MKKTGKKLELIGRILGFFADKDEIGVATCMAEFKIIERTTYTEGETHEK